MRIVDGTVYFDHGDGEVDEHGGTTARSDARRPIPTSYLDYLQGIADDVHVVGHETRARRRHDAATRATLDLDGALARSTHAGAAGRRSKVAVGLFGDSEDPGDGLGRRARPAAQDADVDRSLGRGREARRPDRRARRRSTSHVELYDFGVPVDVQAPAGASDALAAAPGPRAPQSDLRNALTAEKTMYTDTQVYTANPAQLKQIEPSLDWGGKLTVVVGDAAEWAGHRSSASRSARVGHDVRARRRRRRAATPARTTARRPARRRSTTRHSGFRPRW